MNKRDNGGPAYPVQPFSTDARNWSDGAEGMTLLDWYAGQALAGLLAQGAQRFETGEPASCDWYASVAHSLAKAMLSEKRRREAATGDDPDNVLGRGCA